MPRYDDRYYDRYDRYDRYGSNTKLYVGRLSMRTRTQDVEHLFSRYGRVRYVELKHDYGFVEFSDPRDADDARYELDGREIDGSRIIVEFARGTPRGPGGSRDYMGRGPPPGSGCCFNCGIDGHWARDCNAGDWKNKCYRCGERGHIERNCQNSPKNLKRGRSYSRSLSPRRERSRSRSADFCITEDEDAGLQQIRRLLTRVRFSQIRVQVGFSQVLVLVGLRPGIPSKAVSGCVSARVHRVRQILYLRRQPLFVRDNNKV